MILFILVIVMECLHNITVTEIAHVGIVNFKDNDTGGMKERPWYGLAFSLGGELEYIHGDEKILLKDNRVVLIPRGITYSTHCIRSGNFAVINFRTLNDIGIDKFKTFQIAKMHNIEKIFYKMHNTHISDTASSFCDTMSLFYKIISELINDFTRSRLPVKLNCAIDYIEKNISDFGLCNRDIAEYAGISEVYLRKLFTKYMSASASSYILTKRIEKAKLLLNESVLTITEISEKCGYSCIYYFCRTFKKETGFTPSEYRRYASAIVVI